jgi:hypothetical protein
MNSRCQITQMLNNALSGFINEEYDVVIESLIKRFKLQFHMDIKPENVRLVKEYEVGPYEISIAYVCLDINGEHYESVIRNLVQNYGYEP